VKEFWKSKTFWFNAVAVAVFVASQFGYLEFVPDADVLALVAAIVNIVLRFTTKQPLKLR